LRGFAVTADSKKKRQRRPRPLAEALEPGRLGWRLGEWCKATGTSRPTLWRHAKSGAVKIVYVGDTPLVPRSEAVRLGLIDA
jgi:hypothetical protein